MNSMVFYDTEFEIVDIHGQPWLRGPQIGDALGYASSRKKIHEIYDRHRKEFTPDMVAMVQLPSASGLQLTRVFSLRGARLIAMHSKTERAAAFRAWVLDLLEQVETREDRRQLALEAEVLRLHPRYRRLRELFAFGLSRKEMAGSLGVAVSTVHQDLVRLSACGLLDQPKLLEGPRHV